MIVLDENTLQESILRAIERWYPGRVCVVADLRPGTVIKDEAIAAVLMQQRHPTFVTTNAIDFWLRVHPHERYCVVCLPIPNERQNEIPDLLRRLLHLPEFCTKAARMGRVARVTSAGVQFYDLTHPGVQTISWTDPSHIDR